jgi:ammonium transporter Rh
MLLLGIFQAFLYSLNEIIVFFYIHVFDIGGSMTVFTFGAFFAIGAGLVNPISKDKVSPEDNSPTHPYSNLFAILGTLFLWVFFPSFNSARVGLDLQYGLPFGNQSHRAVMNTILALTGSNLITFLLSPFLRDGKYDIEHILRATIAGGVISASSADLIIEPFSAILLGAWGGLFTMLSLRFIHERFKFHDTFGVLSTYGIPGLWGGFISAVYVDFLRPAKLGFDPTLMFRNTRSHSAQAGSQIGALFSSLGIGLFGGLFSGLCVKLLYCYRPEKERMYQDVDLWLPDKE